MSVSLENLAQSVQALPSASKPSFTLRLATENDAEQVASLIARVWTKNFGWSVPPQDLEIHLKTALSVQTIRQSIRNIDNRFVVAQTDVSANISAEGTTEDELANGHSTTPIDPNTSTSPPQIIGIAQLIFGTSEPCLTLPNPVELNRLYIENGYQGSGLARALVEEAQSVVKEVQSTRSTTNDDISLQGTPSYSLWLGVWEDNPRAVRFYEKMGFKKVGEHSFLVGENGRVDWVMEKGFE